MIAVGGCDETKRGQLWLSSCQPTDRAAPRRFPALTIFTTHGFPHPRCPSNLILSLSFYLLPRLLFMRLFPLLGLVFPLFHQAAALDTAVPRFVPFPFPLPQAPTPPPLIYQSSTYLDGDKPSPSLMMRCSSMAVKRTLTTLTGTVPLLGTTTSSSYPSPHLSTPPTLHGSTSPAPRTPPFRPK